MAGSSHTAARVHVVELLARICPFPLSGPVRAAPAQTLRGVPRVSSALRDRICEEARKMGYRPAPMLQALSTYRRVNRIPGIQSALVWLCCRDPPEAMHTRKEFHAYWLGVKSVAEKHGYLEKGRAKGKVVVRIEHDNP
jgi:hypothetical protein